MEKIIDIHTHLFNLKYLPVAGILVRYGKGIITERIAFAIEKPLVKYTRSEFDTAAHAIVAKRAIKKDYLNTNFFEIKNDILEEIPAEEMLDTEVLAGLEEFQDIAKSEGFLSPEEIIDFDHLKKNNEIISDTALKSKLKNLFGRMLEWICSKVKAIVNYLKWFRFMMHSEEEILEYIAEKDEPDVDLYVHHLMDVDYYFNDTVSPDKFHSHFKYIEQINNMAALNQKHKDKIMGFVAFDPSKANAVDIVKNAIKDNGFKGVKFYPPMGYRAYDDVRFKQNIEALFDYCIKEDIPVFTHCNKQGFEAVPQKHSGHNSNPMFWQSLLTQNDGKYKNLRLCLAHAGGGEGWFSKNKIEDEIIEADIIDLPNGIDEKQKDWNSSYAKIVYKLCLKYPNVYCDFAYLDEITNPLQAADLSARLIKLFQTSPGFSKKVIYGSDWHMLFQEGKNSVYFNDYKKLFNGTGFTDQNRSDFFCNNALAYLK